MESKVTNPGKLETPADCEQLAAFEWDNEIDQTTWADRGGRDAYVTQRAASLLHRVKVEEPAAPAPSRRKKGTDADRTVAEE